MKLRGRALLLACLSAAAASSPSSSSPAPAAVASFAANASAAAGAPLSLAITNSLGSSHGATTLRATWRDHFSRTLRELPFARIRFHGILDDDMSTFLGGHANGALVFDSLDFFVAAGVTPTVELSFMPAALASNASLVVEHYAGGISPPRNWTAWSGFVTEFVALCVERYGATVVRSWLFEVWNEPNCGFYAVSNGCGEAAGNQSAYFTLYAHTAAAVRAADAGVRVGGPATAKLSWLQAFIDFARAGGLPLDFLSSHLKPMDDILPATREAFGDALSAAAALAAANGLPLVLTEFNAGRDYHNFSLMDSSYAAAFLLHTHLRTQALANVSLSWWAMTDNSFEEGGADPLPYHPGAAKYGLRTMYGVPKPSFRGMQLISEQARAPGAAALPLAVTAGAPARSYASVTGAGIGAAAGTVDALLTIDAAGWATALFCNYNISVQAPPDVPLATLVSLTLAGLAAPLPTAATLELIDADHANPMATWLAAGSPLYPRAAEIAAEEAASQLEPLPLALEAVGADAVRASFTLQPYAMARLRFAAARAAPAART